MLVAAHCTSMWVEANLNSDMNKSKQSQDKHLLSIDSMKMCMACNAMGTQVARVSMRNACLKMSDDASNAILWA